MAIRIGCGSWTDSAYVGLLYAKGTPSTERLAVYSQWFDRVEVNSFYHHIPKLEYVERWIGQTPKEFRFDVKLTEEFSMNPSAAAKGGAAARFMRAVQPFIAAKRLGVFLLTLPPSFAPPQRRLEELTEVISLVAPYSLAVELRHRDWLAGTQREATLAFFRAHRLVWVSVDQPRVEAVRILPRTDVVTHPSHAYFRLHGRNPGYAEAGSTEEGHRHDYTEAELQEIAGRIKGVAREAAEVSVTLNNHADDLAPKAAIALKRLLGQPVLSGPPPKPGEQGEMF